MNGTKGDNHKDPYPQGKSPDPNAISERKFAARMGRLQQAVGVENDAGLAKALGISHQSVASARKRRQLPYAWVAEISERHGISSDWLLHGEGSMRRRDRPGPYGEATRGGTERFAIQEGHPHYGTTVPEVEVIVPAWAAPDFGSFDHVPLVEAHLAVGGGAFVLSEDVKDYFAFQRDWLRRIATAPNNVFMMSVRGPSMEPTITDGDIVMVDIGRKRIYDGYIYGLGIGETIAIKRLESLPEGMIRILSDNRREYPPYETNAQDLRILGQVIWYARELVKRGIP